MSISNPHDKLFKEVESIKENALDLLQAILPTNILEQLDLSSLELDNHSYTDEKLKTYFTDLVYNCRLQGEKENLLIVFLLEHKSYRVDYPHFQLLSYILRIWQANIKQKTGLRLVIPIVFCHGVEKWEYRPLTSCFPIKNKLFAQFIPDFTYLLADLSHYPDEQLKGQLFKREANKILSLLMKHVYDEEYIRRELKAIFKIGEFYYTKEEGERFLISILYYLFESAEGVDEETIVEGLRNAIHRGGDLSMTIAEKLREEGLKEKALETAKKMLKKNYPLEEIAELTGLDIETIKGLKK